MSKFLARIRAALVVGLVWALVWLPAGPLLGLIFDPNDTMDEPWIAVGILPGFLAGVVFSIVLGIAAGRRKLEEISMTKVGAWGALAGAIIGSVPFVLGDRDGRVIERPWLLPLVIISSLTVLSAASAVASFGLARRSERRELPEPT